MIRLNRTLWLTASYTHSALSCHVAHIKGVKLVIDLAVKTTVMRHSLSLTRPPQEQHAQFVVGEIE